jgi:glycosyltransferase involved in cell wall biosynthesis
MASTGDRARRHRRVLIIVENLSVPFDRRVWSEATTLVAHGYEVSVICPVGQGYEKRREVLDGVHIYRHPLPIEARRAIAYPLEYSTALFWEFVLAWRVLLTRDFDIIHACNPPDTIFLIGGFFKLLLRKKFLFDHHDLNPELYEAKFGRRDLFYWLLVKFERWTFRTADVSIATNKSYQAIAVGRGGMDPKSVFVVRSGPKLERMQRRPPVEAYKNGRRYLVGYLGVMGQQEGCHYLLKSVRYIVRDLGNRNVQFALVGGGPELPSLKRLARELGIEDHVTFTGRVSDDVLLDVLNSADLCVNPDEHNPMNDKSTMNKIMEYMALGKAIVQFDLTEGRFSAQDGSLYAKPNDFVDLAEKILELLEDPARRARMGAFGYRRVIDELAWPHEEPKLLAAYDALFR